MADDEEGSNLLFSDGLADALSAFARARSATQELSSDPPLTFEYQYATTDHRRPHFIKNKHTHQHHHHHA